MELNASAATLGGRSGFPPIEYTFPSMSDWNFTAGKVPFNKAGMGGILNAADQALSSIFPHYSQYLNYSMDDNILNFNQVNILKMVTENKGPTALVSVALVSAIIITLVGFCWCCVRCCCRDKGCCSGKSEEDVRASKIARKSDKYRRAIYGIFFAAFVILFTFGLVTCFVTNEQVKDNVNKLPKEVDKALVDCTTYIDATINQTNALLVDNYASLATVLTAMISQSGNIIKNGLSEKTGAQALNNLTDVVDTVENVFNSLQSVERTSKSLKDKADQLQNGLRRSKDTLIQLLERCLAPKCIELKELPEIRSLRVQNDFQNLPDITELLRELGNFFGTNVRESIDRGRRSFDMLSIRIQAEVDPFRKDISDIIEETRTNLIGTCQNLTNALHEIPIEDAREDVKKFETEMKKYAPYWYYAVLLICCALTCIFLLMAFGIFVGFCGKQPGSEYSNECCSRKTGSTFIHCGVFFIFLTFLVFTLVALVHFLLAGVGGQVICEAISSLDSQTEKAFRLPKLSLQQVKDEYEVPGYSKMLSSCQQGSSAYVAFDLQQVYNLEELKTLSDRFAEPARRLAKQVNIPADSTEDITFLTPETKEQINRFANSQITRIKFDNFADQLSQSITSVDLRNVIGRLKSILDDPNAALMNTDIISEIRTEIMFIETLEEKVLTPMLAEVRDSVEHLRALSRDQKDLTQRIQRVAKAAEEAQEALHNSGVTRQIRDLADSLVEDIILRVKEFGDFTHEKMHDEMGQCHPLYNAFNSTVAAVCVNILSPIGGYWFGISFLLVLFIPILIIGCSLAGLYSKYKAAGYESATYYSSAYGDGDTIPLSLSANNARRHKRGRATEARYSSRFDDTSHKAWGSQMVFNNHHTPPASGEYERPPPYYYPGPAQS
ncbi:unnamed protein product [Allacma fusca]|uniref:Prominin-like protein n=1 Tax=Allacma fusca TaxID=39272 RepID=A0A8J2NQ38_9HEXA|nr:unnamed protein product [Allacma fusca]